MRDFDLERERLGALLDRERRLLPPSERSERLWADLDLSLLSRLVSVPLLRCTARAMITIKTIPIMAAKTFSVFEKAALCPLLLLLWFLDRRREPSSSPTP